MGKLEVFLKKMLRSLKKHLIILHSWGVYFFIIASMLLIPSILFPDLDIYSRDVMYFWPLDGPLLRSVFFYIGMVVLIVGFFFYFLRQVYNVIPRRDFEKTK